MREIIAKLVAALTVAVIVGFSLLFASMHNRPAQAKEATAGQSAQPAANNSAVSQKVAPAVSAEPEPVAAKAPDLVARGRAVYAQQNCATCHSIAGGGNPRAPLDDVGARYDAKELRAWVTGTGVVADVLAPGIVRRKQRYLEMPANDLDALVAYLSTLKPAK